MDPVADLLTRIRNAGMARHESTRIPFSRMKKCVLEIMKEEGYISDLHLDKGDGIHQELVVYLKYQPGYKMVIKSMKKISKPGRRVYCKADDLPDVKSGLGTSIISTSRGIVCNREAKKLNVGGEVLCEIW